MRTRAVTMRPSETQEQQWLFQWCASMLHAEPRFELLYASANSGVRPSKMVWNRAQEKMQRICVTGRILQSMGVKAGIPDLQLACPVGPDSGLFIELKKSGLTPRQAWAACTADEKLWLMRLAGAGYQTTVCSGWINAARVLCTYLRVPWLAQAL